MGLRDDQPRLTIKEARAYLVARHGITISRATFWRVLLKPGTDWATQWDASLELRGPNATWVFATVDIDRMATCYRAFQRGAPHWASVGDATAARPVRSPRGRLVRDRPAVTLVEYEIESPFCGQPAAPEPGAPCPDAPRPV